MFRIRDYSYNTQAFVICALAAFFYCYEYYLRVAPSVLSTDLIKTYGISNAGLGMMSAFFYYAYVPAQMPVGLLLDRFGPRKVLTIACSFCVIGSYIFATTSHVHAAEAARFIIGIGAAFAFVGYLKVAANWLPRQYYAIAVGLSMIIGMAGAMGGEIVLAWLISHMPWRAALHFDVWVGLVLTGLLWLIIRDQPAKDIAPERVTKKDIEPLMQGLLKAVKSSQVWLVGIIGCFTYLPLSSFAEMWAVPFLETIGYDKTVSASASSMIFLGFGIGAPIWGFVSHNLHSRRVPLIIGSLISAICMLLVIGYPHMNSVCIFALLLSVGFFSSAEILVFAVGHDISVKSSSGTTTATINMLVMLGGIVLQPLIGKILDVISGSTIEEYQTALLILPLSLFVACCLSFILKESHPEAKANTK